jgi:hypothetical protein
MNKSLLLWLLPGAAFLLTIVAQQSCLAQYPGGGYGGGGYGGGGYGRGGYGGMNQGIPQTPSTPSIPNIAGEMATKEIKWLNDSLSLDKEQQKAVKKLYRDYATQQQDALKDIVGSKGKPSPEDVKAFQQMMLMLNEEKEDQLKPILTPAQWTRYQAKKEEMQQKIGGIRPPAPGVARPLPKQ